MIETLSTIFAVGTIWFWITCLVVSIIFTTAVENDNYVAPSIISIILGIAYWKYLSLISWQTFAVGISVYVIIGMIWSVYRWYKWVQETVLEYNNNNNGEKLDRNEKAFLKNDINVVYHKNKIISWIMYWPWSMIWNLTGDFFNMIYNSMVGIYDKISEKALNKIDVK